MKRTLVTTIALSLAALAITAAAPTAAAAPIAAAPGIAPMPTTRITTVIEQEGFTIDVMPPDAASASLTLTIHGTRNARVQAFAGRNIAAVHETSTVGETEPDGTLVLKLLAPAGDWRPGTVYEWQVLGTELGADAYARGTFTTPTWNPAPTKPPVTDPEENAITATVAAPPTRHGAVVITVKGAHGGDRIEAGVERTKPGGDALITLDTGNPDGRPDVLAIAAPNDGWEARTQYDWWVKIADRGFTHRGHFTTPTWTDATKPVERMRTEIQIPTTRTASLVFTVDGIDPGVGVNVSLGRSVNEQADGLERTVADASGRAVVTIRPGEGGWRSGARYHWFVWAEYEDADNDEVLRQLGGSLTMPTWTRDDGVERPGTITKPKERTGGVSKTGV